MAWVHVHKSRYLLEYTFFPVLLISALPSPVFLSFIKNGIRGARHFVL